MLPAMVRKIIEHTLGEISNRRELSIDFTAQHRTHGTHRTHRTTSNTSNASNNIEHIERIKAIEPNLIRGSSRVTRIIRLQAQVSYERIVNKAQAS